MDIGVAEIHGIVRHFTELEDPRSHVNRLHLLVDVIVISMLGVLAGADGPLAIARWAAAAMAETSSAIARGYSFPRYDRTGPAFLEAVGLPEMFCGLVELFSRRAIDCTEGSTGGRLSAKSLWTANACVARMRATVA